MSQTNGEAGATPPVVCSLDAASKADRVDAWQAITEIAAASDPIDGGIRLTFDRATTSFGYLAGLVEAEQTCCAFYDFSLRISHVEITLEVRGPDEAQPMLLELFRAPT